MSWGIDFTSQAREDLVGFASEDSEAITDAWVRWVHDGPPLDNRRVLGGIVFYEVTVAERILVGYAVKEEPPTFVILWVRSKPGLFN